MPRVLKSTAREISTLSPTLRSAWDGRPLALLTRTAPARSTDAHISIIGHITATELRHHTTRVELANGFINRFVLVAVRRVRLLPEGGNPYPLKGSGLVRYLASVLKHAQTAGRVTLDPAARELWWHVYPHLTQPADGLAGAILRAPKRTPSASRSSTRYSTASATSNLRTSKPRSRSGTTPPAPPPGRSARRPATRSPNRSTPRSLRSPDGLTRTQISDLLHRNLPADQLSASAPRPRRHRPRPPAKNPRRRTAHRAVDRPPTAHDLRLGHTPSPTGLGQSNAPDGAGRHRAKRRERKRSDLDSHAAGATIIQVQGARGPAAAGTRRADLIRFFVPHP